MTVENTLTEILERHKKEIEEFVQSCPHPEISDWMPFMWAPGHYGNRVKVCTRCNKIMEEEKLLPEEFYDSSDAVTECGDK